MAERLLELRIIANHLPEAAAGVEPATAQRLNRLVKRIIQNAQRRARVDTGEMRAGLQDGGGDGLDRRVVALAAHTVHNEFGTRYMSAQPMLRPAVEEAASAVEQEFIGFEGNLW